MRPFEYIPPSPFSLAVVSMMSKRSKNLMGESFKPLQSKEILLQFLNSRVHGRQGSLEDNWQYLFLATLRVDRHGSRISLDTSLAL